MPGQDFSAMGRWRLVIRPFTLAALSMYRTKALTAR